MLALVSLSRLLAVSAQRLGHAPVWLHRRLSPAASAMAAPSLSFWERQPAYGALAAARLADVQIELKPDPKGSKTTTETLTLPSG